MDTVYYTFNTRRVKVSGGPDLVRLIPAPSAARKSDHTGEIVDLEQFRRRMDTKKAWKELSLTAMRLSDLTEEEGDDNADEPEAAPAPLRSAGNVPLWLELGATAAVLLAGLSAAAAFLALF